MSLYGFMNKSEVQPKLYAEKESGLNILWKEVLWSDTYGKFFE
jgi:hypothetical protein